MFLRTVSCILALIGIDGIWYGVVKYNKKDSIYANTTLRWFLIHFSANVFIGCLCLPSVMKFLKDPYVAFEQDGQEEYLVSATSKWPLTLSVVLHAYHMIGGFRLTWEDWFHHLTFVPTLALPGMIYDWGCFCNWFAFFICGIPGAIDYFVLAMQKMNYCLDYNQKRISANMNVWIRVPGIIFGVGIGYLLFMRRLYHVPTLAICLQLILLPTNAIFYSKQSIISYTLHTVKKYIPNNKDWNELKRIKNEI